MRAQCYGVVSLSLPLFLPSFLPSSLSLFLTTCHVEEENTDSQIIGLGWSACVGMHDVGRQQRRHHIPTRLHRHSLFVGLCGRYV
ncbi:hypothetical protein BKA81DRAFT_348576, partial [Phyllosticta paracitricarpa]